MTVTITTHSEGGLTENDFELAEKIDALPSDCYFCRVRG